MSHISKKEIFGFSGIATASYFFWLNSSFLIDYDYFLIQTIVLFFFSIIFFIFIYFLSNKKFIKKKFLIDILNLILITWIVVISIKTFFYITNITTLPKLLSNNINLELKYKSELINRLLIFLIPYFFIFSIIFFLKKKIKQIYEFFSFIGISLIILIIFNVSSELIFKFNLNKITNVNNAHKYNPEKRVIWIIFDEFDPEIAFTSENKRLLKNFYNFKSESVYASNFYTTAKNTLYSMTSNLIGKPVKNLEIKKRIVFVDDGKNKTPFIFKNTIFKEIQNGGNKFKILSSYFPYCYHLKLGEENCLSLSMSKYSKFNDQFYSGIFHVFSPLKKITRFIELNESSSEIKKNKFPLITNINKIKNAKPKIDINSIEKFDESESNLTFDHFNETILSDTNFIFMQIFLPHLGKEGDNFAEKIFKINVQGYKEQYLLNLKATDIILGKLLDSLKKYDSKESLIILSSDHWFRKKDTNTSNVYPSLFMARINNENEFFNLENKISSLSINKIIKDFMDDKILYHSELSNLLKKEKFHKPYSYIDDNIN